MSHRNGFESFALLDVLPLLLMSAIFYDLFGVLGVVIGFGLINARYLVAPIYVITLAHVILIALLEAWPQLPQLVGFELGAMLLLARPFTRDPRPGRSILSLTVLYGVVIGLTVVGLQVSETLAMPVLVLVIGLAVASYSLHRLEVVTLPNGVDTP